MPAMRLRTRSEARPERDFPRMLEISGLQVYCGFSGGRRRKADAGRESGNACRSGRRAAYRMPELRIATRREIRKMGEISGVLEISGMQNHDKNTALKTEKRAASDDRRNMRKVRKADGDAQRPIRPVPSLQRLPQMPQYPKNSAEEIINRARLGAMDKPRS